ncbi:hypothetical protein VSDG_04286 [Cytospora chrysosperma]|uniref:Zinc finger PHD-type domain-containing protein n=1 Tax=Cytospora chrysosperma TaxID=252740 RepID=A0A423W5C7_CYTCH|nr:hypothetical protein VSDG_04286 [Valsa sordida]
MASGQNSDDELLAMLQPLTAPEEFVFETTIPQFVDTSDEDDGGQIPGPAPPAPLASMAPMAPMAPMEPSGSGISSTSQTNGQEKEDKDDDEIEYESPAKRAARSPAKRPTKNRRKSTPDLKDGDESGYESAAELLKTLAKSSSKSYRGSKQNRKEEGDDDDYEVVDESPVKAGRRRPKPAAEVPAEPTPEPGPERKELNFEVVISPLLPQAAQEYTLIPPGDEVYRVLELIKTGVQGEAWLSVEFEDGRIDQVAFDQLSSYPNGRQALANYRNPKKMDSDADDYLGLDFSGNPRKRKAAQDPDFEVNVDADEDEAMLDASDDLDEDDEGLVLPGKRRKLQKAQNGSSGPSSRTRRSDRNRPLPSYYDEDDQQSGDESDGRSKRKRNLRNTNTSRSETYNDDMDELQHDDDDDGLFRVTSDLLPQKKSRRRGNTRNLRTRGKFKAFGSRGGDDIAFERPRRSQRDHKTTGSMAELGLDEELYAIEDERLPAAPKASGAKEIFESIQHGPFKDAHCRNCDTCGGSIHAPNKGMMIYCQGCSMSYHKICLGFRSTREHAVTKVGPKQFVLQCRHCIGVRKKKDTRAPSLEVCQVCQVKGPACDAFAPKRTATQEQKLREENGGEDPVNPVDQQLLNNPENILFRCVACHCAYHFEHLPPLRGNNDAEGDIRADRLAKYSTEWKCKNCLDMDGKVDALVAWRPVDLDAYVAGHTTLDLGEDAKEYLIRWAERSYAHCEWKPGPWVWGVTNAAMRNSFPKRNDGANLLPKFDEKDAIPEEYLLADVILDVRYKGAFNFVSKKVDLEKTWMIDQALIKFEGLDYTEAVWDEPPDYDSGDRWKAFISAYSEFLNGKHFKSEPAHSIKERLKKFRDLDFREDIEFEDGTNGSPQQPRALTGTLMKYQIQGLNWILHSFWEQRSR